MSETPVLLATPVRLDARTLRAEFPILATRSHGKPLVYLDSANTTQKPAVVIEATRRFYAEENANIHRSTYALSEKATAVYEGAREEVRRFLGASETKEIVFVRGTTEAINLVAASFGQAFVRAGDEILLTGLEHHSNIVPWQLLCERSGAVLRVLPITDDGELRLDELPHLLTARTKLLAVSHVSNALGTINPVQEIVAAAHARGVPVLVDGAQAAPHFPVNVGELDCDFYAFSSHKMYGPTGIGVLYGKRSWLEKMPPYQGGGDMISSVTFAKTTYNSLPWKFEAGTSNLAGAAGLSAAVAWLSSVGLPAAAAHEHDLLVYATARLREIPGLRIYGTAPKKAAVISFLLDEIHPHDVGTILDQEGICIRTGQHCAQPVMDRFGIPATARVSFGVYNTREDVDALVSGLRKVREIFG
ncbi:MAG: cysteine desulfurase [Thermoanaerobaculia bacterium]